MGGAKLVRFHKMAQLASAPSLRSIGIGAPFHRNTHIPPRVNVEPTEWAPILRKSSASIEADLMDLQRQGICERYTDQVEISDRYWPFFHGFASPSGTRISAISSAASLMSNSSAWRAASTARTRARSAR